MVILGLTGSIGMGKSTAAAMLRDMGVPVYESDRAVHRVMAPGGPAVAAVAEAFPGAVEDGAVDRRLLRERVFGDAAALCRLERIVHPLVRRVQDRFLRRAAQRRAALVVLDVPLLFEVGLHVACDAVLVITAPPFLQRARVLARPGMTESTFARVAAQQIPDTEKRRRADFVVSSGLGRAPSLRALREVVRLASAQRSGCWPRPARYPDPHARNRSRHRNYRPLSSGRRQDRRDRLSRAQQPYSDGPELS